MARLFGSMLRAAAFPLMRGLAFRGFTNISQANRIVKEALGSSLRTQEFYSVYRGFLSEWASQAAIKFVRKDSHISKGRYLEREWTQPGRFRYTLEFKGYNPETGEELTFFRTAYANTYTLKGTIESRGEKIYWQEQELTRYGEETFGAFTLEKVNVAQAYHKLGAGW